MHPVQKEAVEAYIASPSDAVKKKRAIEGRDHANLRLGDLRGHGADGVSVCDCGDSKCLSKEVECGLHKHYRACAPSGVQILWKVDGAGAPKGIGPYDVCLRIVPLPLPDGMVVTV